MVAPIDPSTLKAIKANDLLREGHFAMRSGRHTAWLIDRDRLLADPAFASQLAYILAKTHFTDRIDTVATPSIWGAGLAQWVAYFLEPKAKVVSATPVNGEPTVAQGLEDLVHGKRVLVVDNIIVTGTTLGRFLPRLVAMDATIVGIGTLWNANSDVVQEYPVLGVLNDLIPSYPPDSCPLCVDSTRPVEQVPY